MALVLPPLNAVRAFVAAARHQSFSRAAQELHVTHGAVSRQIKGLEADLGVALFERRVRQVVLTVEGQAFYAQAEAGLALIGHAATALRSGAAGRAVRINVRPSFAVRWLIPRLPDFVARHPGIEPEVVTSTATPARAPEGFDVAVRRGLQGWPASLQVAPFLEDEAFAVASPALLRSMHRPVESPRDLAAFVLLGARSRKGDWDDWCRQAGIGRLKAAGRLHLDHLHLVFQAAIDGLGLAMAPRSLWGNDLRQQRLVALLPRHGLPLDRYYYGISPEASEETRCFVKWLEAAQDL
ncbi:LysR substrate-binding domain-containing protein [Acidovorax sp. PRC11]|nr:LysR substrate-binding domain-containing protein [Acidovorax sp. PRC11]MDT0138969.1 LysR substrate-binding domain-containing protein [Acidovorax sp. PRC11]